jgi:capsular polysaccharide biosynthesis protein
MRENIIDTDMEISMKSLIIALLSAWRKILLAAVIVAVLLGGYKTVGWLTEKPQSVLTEEEIAETQAQISSYESAIANDQVNIPLQEEALERLREEKENYQLALDKAAEVEKVTAAVVSNVLEINDKLAELDSQIASTESYIASMNSEITSYTAANEASRAQLEETTTSKGPKDAIVGIIFGAILGAFLMCVYVAMRYLMDGRLREGQDMECRYGLPVLAAVAQSKVDASKNGKFDQWIRRWEGADAADPQKEYQIAAAKLELLCRDRRKLLFTGTVSQEKLQAVFAGVKACLPEGEYQLLAAENPMHSPETLAQLQDAELVLVEEIGASAWQAMDDLVTFLSLAQVSVVGAIVI